MSVLHLDVETYSAADLQEVGAHVYASHPSTRLLLLSWALDDGPINTVDVFHGEDLSGELRDALLSRDVVKVAHNAAFERAILARADLIRARWDTVVLIRATPWRCTMVHALALAMPAGLEALGEALGLGGKLPDGRKLLNQFCTPARGGPEAQPRADWERLVDYNRRDVELEREAHKRLEVYPLRPDDWAHWTLDQRINDRGVPVDVRFCEAAAEAAERNAEVLAAANTAVSLTSIPQLHAWLASRGVEVADLRAPTIEALLDDPDEMPPDVREVLTARLEVSSSSVKKYRTAAASTDTDGRARGLLQFWGARRTGRWAGRRIQIQNLPRGSISDPTELIEARSAVLAGYDVCRALYPQVSDLLRSLVRTAIAAPPGMALVSADLASIESVMLAWASNCKPLLDVFAAKRDPYIDFATRLFGVEYDQVTSKQRKLAKPAVLGCGYGMGAGGLAAYAASMGIALTTSEAERHVETFRDAYRAIPEFWYAIERAALAAMRLRDVEVQSAGPTGFRFSRQGSFLFLHLPSGRRLSYYKPSLQAGAYGQRLTYDNGEGKRVRIETRGAKLCENIVQAIARDVLVDGLMRAEADRLEVVAHVHDEIIALAPEADAEATLERLRAVMGQAPEWAPGAPIRAAGWWGPVYRKD